MPCLTLQAHSEPHSLVLSGLPSLWLTAGPDTSPLQVRRESASGPTLGCFPHEQLVLSSAKGPSCPHLGCAVLQGPLAEVPPHTHTHSHGASWVSSQPAWSLVLPLKLHPTLHFLQCLGSGIPRSTHSPPCVQSTMRAGLIFKAEHELSDGQDPGSISSGAVQEHSCPWPPYPISSQLSLP